jgi:hypothetical protein
MQWQDSDMMIASIPETQLTEQVIVSSFKLQQACQGKLFHFSLLPYKQAFMPKYK